MGEPAEPAEPVSLGTWPTPVEPMPRLAAELGLGAGDLLAKRDDLSGLGGGGNKVRKLEWTIADARQRGADTLVTTGAPQSSHARLTAAAAARLGLRAVLVFPGQPPSSAAGNLVLDALFGAQIVYTGATGAAELGEAAKDVMGRLAAAGQVPYLIPFGGSSALAARGYVTAGREVLAAVPGVRTVVVALGSGGTMAGLIAAVRAGEIRAGETTVFLHTGGLPGLFGHAVAYASGLGRPRSERRGW
jgi:L-cysteate sulfo-lyase